MTLASDLPNEKIAENKKGFLQSVGEWFDSKFNTINAGTTEPETKERFVIEKDDCYILTANTANAVLLRGGVELDSSELLKSFVVSESRTDERPKVDLLHSHIELGEVLESALVGRSLFDNIKINKSPLGDFVARKIQDGSWGFSHEYDPIGDPVIDEHNDNKFYRYDQGTRMYVSVLPENQAANHGTGGLVLRSENMSTLDGLLENLKEEGAPDEALEQIRSAIEKQAQKIEDEHEVKRSQAEPHQEKQVVEKEIVFDDGVQELLKGMIDESVKAHLEPVERSVTKLSDNTLKSGDLKQVVDLIKGLSDEVSKLRSTANKDDQQRLADLAAQMPPKRERWNVVAPGSNGATVEQPDTPATLWNANVKELF